MEWGAEQKISIEIKILVMKSIYYIMVTHIVNPELDQPNITPFLCVWSQDIVPPFESFQNVDNSWQK